MKQPAQTGLSVVANAMTVEVPDARDGRERKRILKDVNFRIEPGEFVCVLGPSGSGKSTLVRAMLGEREIAAGRLLVGGHDVLVKPTPSAARSATCPSGTSIQKLCRSSGRFTMQRRCDSLQKRPPRSDRPQSIVSSPMSASTACGTRRLAPSPGAK